MGRALNPPPQFGHTLSSNCSTHVRQNVHSNEQIIASREFGGRRVPQFSQVGRISSMDAVLDVLNFNCEAIDPCDQSGPGIHRSSRPLAQATGQPPICASSVGRIGANLDMLLAQSPTQRISSRRKLLKCRHSSVVEQRFCKPLVGSSNLSAGTDFLGFIPVTSLTFYTGHIIEAK
jgi:hypothetical protein